MEVIVPYELRAYFKTEFDIQESKKEIKKKGGDPIHYIVLHANTQKDSVRNTNQGVSPNKLGKPTHYDFKSHNAMMYIQVWLEFYDRFHETHGETDFAIGTRRDRRDCVSRFEDGDRKQLFG